MIGEIVITRHGHRRAWTEDGRDQFITGILKDDELTSIGEVQAIELASFLANLPVHKRPTAIFCSPYYRCLQTADPVSRSLDLPIYVEHGLAEWRSTLLRSPLHQTLLSASDLQKWFPNIDSSWTSVWQPSRNGENVELLHERMTGFADVFLPQVEARLLPAQHARILLVSHAAPIIGLVRHLVNDRQLSIRPGCCSLTELMPKRDGEWAVELLSGGAHLSEASRIDWRQWGFENHGDGYGKNHPPVSEIKMDPEAGCQLHKGDADMREQKNKGDEL